MGEYIKIPLTQGYVTIIDADDLTGAASLRWCANVGAGGLIYAVRTIRRPGGTFTAEKLHRRIVGLTPGDDLQVDHINHDTLDNRSANLRVATQAENQRNASGAQRNSVSGVRGVSWRKARGKWQARVQHNGHQRRSLHDTIEAAAAARDALARELHGEFFSPAIRETDDIGDLAGELIRDHGVRLEEADAE